jgi:hypothetical protein
LRISVLRNLLIILVVLLGVQFMLGGFMILYPIPDQVNTEFFSYTGTGLIVHHYVAAAILVFAVLAMAFGFVIKNSLLSRLSIVGFLLLVGAFVSGIAFVYLQKINLYSIAMGTCFILALTVYLAAIFLVKK